MSAKRKIYELAYLLRAVVIQSDPYAIYLLKRSFYRWAQYRFGRTAR
jgi:hypothetical protein